MHVCKRVSLKLSQTIYVVEKQTYILYVKCTIKISNLQRQTIQALTKKKETTYTNANIHTYIYIHIYIQSYMYTTTRLYNRSQKNSYKNSQPQLQI